MKVFNKITPEDYMLIKGKYLNNIVAFSTSTPSQLFIVRVLSPDALGFCDDTILYELYGAQHLHFPDGHIVREWGQNWCWILFEDGDLDETNEIDKMS